MTLGDQERNKEFELKKEIKALKAQIEKMKCCDNCKHRLKVLEMEVLGLYTSSEPAGIFSKAKVVREEACVFSGASCLL